MSRKIIAVVGATGNQGGAVAEAILADPAGGFGVRAITRDPTKPRARALAAKGAEVVAADLDEPRSVERAFAGAYGAFCVTNYWERATAEHEKRHAKAMADAAAAAGVRHVVRSTLEDTRTLMRPDDRRMPILQGAYRVPSYDGKAEADAYFADVPTTFLRPAFFWDSFYVYKMAPAKGPDGAYGWAFPMGEARLAGMAVEDIGRCAHGVFRTGSQHVGETIGLVSESLTMREIGDRIGKALGLGPVTYTPMEPDAYRGLGFPGADVLGNMFQYYRDFEREVTRIRSVERTRALVPGLLTFDRWVARYQDRLPR